VYHGEYELPLYLIWRAGIPFHFSETPARVLILTPQPSSIGKRIRKPYGKCRGLQVGPA
jgi:hypothetical protein